jgi:acetoin utilization deacetylase AcuC-like enzyme
VDVKGQSFGGKASDWKKVSITGIGTMNSDPTAIFFDPVFLRHSAGEEHPESPKRLECIMDLLERVPLPSVRMHRPRAATPEEITYVHTDLHRSRLEALAGQSAQLDPDTAVSPESYAAAIHAAGAAAEAVEHVWAGSTKNAFALVRPPGHHAEPSHAMGFCLFNNVAIGAEVALRRGAERVLILDWDVHHGNGTQDFFYGRRDVLYQSIHQYPFYPGTGAALERGSGAGEGFTVNCPLPAGQGDSDYGAVFHDFLLPIGRAFNPSIVLVSAGFDPHEADPLAEMRVTERGFASMCTAVRRLAEECCGGKLVLLLEGGYHLSALARSVHACLEILAGRNDEFPTGVSSATRGALKENREAQKKFWRSIVQRAGPGHS